MGDRPYARLKHPAPKLAVTWTRFALVATTREPCLQLQPDDHACASSMVCGQPDFPRRESSTMPCGLDSRSRDRDAEAAV